MQGHNDRVVQGDGGDFKAGARWTSGPRTQTYTCGLYGWRISLWLDGLRVATDALVDGRTESMMDAQPQSSSRLIEVASRQPILKPIQPYLVKVGSWSSMSAIRVSDILACSPNSPSWANLVEFLKVDDGFGLSFEEVHECLVFNNRIRVTNERQLLACVQYLYNSHILNADAHVCTAGEEASLERTRMR